MFNSYKKFLLLFFFILFFLPTSVNAQRTEEITFIGSLKLKSKKMVSLKLFLKIKDGKVTGHTVTGISGNKETQSQVVGNYNYKTHKLTFHETNILYTKSMQDERDFCYIYAKTKLILKKNKNRLEGTFVGRYPNNDTCAQGEIKLIGLTYMINKYKRVEKIAKIVTKIDTTRKIIYTSKGIVSELTMNKLLASQVMKVNWKSDNVNMTVWDDGKYDGDTVTIILNNKIILKEYAISKKKKVINAKLKKGENILEIVAINNGKLFPNTANLIFKDESVDYNVISRLKEGDRTRIKFIVN